MELMQVIGMAAGALTSVSMLPQLVKIVKEKEADNVSVVMLVVLLSGLALWTVYGLMREDWPIIVTNSFSFLLNATVLALRIKYSGVKESGNA
ncbi:SemiSWEET transporter [Paraflavisolibacter sp. H34]|uniref:SemiSWEET family sugar transporter n=1 Tax=Huijunlia imazamoxiresistens TaxID=3127457 RepID=UPI00301675C8